MYYTMFKHILQSGYNQQNCLSDGGIHCKKKHKIGKILILFRQNPYTYIIFRINFVVEKVAALYIEG